jgi:hypothetical protein
MSQWKGKGRAGTLIVKQAVTAGRRHMDHYTQAWYETQFELAYRKRRREEFQTLFARIMGLCHPDGDFIPSRPWGNVGDRKNDGYLKSQRTLFQLYGPDEMEAAKTIAKIDDDFFGALPFWMEHFSIWTFVHNALDGLGPDVLKKLLDLGNAHSHICIKQWGFEALRNKLFSLCQTDIASVLGPVPSRTEVLNVRVPELSAVLERLAAQGASAPEDIRPVPANKLEANGLGESARRLLRLGMDASERVRRLFDQYHDPTLGDRIAHTFRAEYERLRRCNYSPDRVFTELLNFTTGQLPHSPEGLVASLTVLAYLFEACDIYERPREETPT